jgi:hypothetical protein
MSQLSYSEHLKTFVEIYSSSSNTTAKFADKELDTYKFLKKTHYLAKKVCDLLDNHVDKSLEEINTLDASSKKLVVGSRTLEAALYKYKHLIPILKALKYYFLHLDVNSYVTMLKELNILDFKVNTLFELFECLYKYNIEFQKVILSEINDGILHSELLYFLQEKKFIEFCNIIKTNQLEINKALHLCSLHESCLLNSPLDKEDFLEVFEKQYSMFFLKKEELNIDDFLNGNKQEDYFSKFSFIFREDFNPTDMTFEEYQLYSAYHLLKLKIYSTQFTKLNDFIEKGLVYILYNKEFINEIIFNQIVNRLTHTRSEYYNLIAKQCFNITTNKHLNFSNPTYNEIINSIYSEETESNTSSSENMEFNLPSDLFEPNKYLTYYNKEEFFNLRPDLKIRKYPEILEKLINELADYGYIENNLEIKRLFAYRFTGKKILRPEELEAIQWNEQGRSKRGYSLLHLIKKLTYDNGTYGKVKEFFTGVEWGEKLNEDANEKNASIRFKRLLHQVSPEDFTNPDKK